MANEIDISMDLVNDTQYTGPLYFGYINANVTYDLNY